jgi:hypothetical protein
VEQARKALARLDEIKADLEQGIRNVEKKYIPTVEARLKELESYAYEYYLIIEDSGENGFTGTLYVTVIKVPEGANVNSAHDVRLKGEDGYWSLFVSHFDRLYYVSIPYKNFGKKAYTYNGRNGPEKFYADDIEKTDDYIKRAVPIILETAAKYNVPDDHIIDQTNREVMFEPMQEREAKKVSA